MKFVGAHVSASPSVDRAPLNAADIGAKAFALFTRTPRRWASKPLGEEQIVLFQRGCAEYGFAPEHILPHGSYLINIGNPDPDKREQSLEAFIDELHRAGQLGLAMVNFHPGAHLGGCTAEECLDHIAVSINLALEATEGVTAVIENTAGTGSNLGYNFEQIARIIEMVEDKSRIGVCIDTCHAFAAGYDISTEEGYERAWEDLDSIIGLKYLRGMHLNDSKRPAASRIDRHESLGRGMLGTDFWHRLMNDPRLDDIPLILETPDPKLWPAEIKWLYSLQEADQDS